MRAASWQSLLDTFPHSFSHSFIRIPSPSSFCTVYWVHEETTQPPFRTDSLRLVLVAETRSPQPPAWLGVQAPPRRGAIRHG